MRNGLDDWHDDGVPELSVGLCVRHGNQHGRAALSVKAHQTRALTRRQAARSLIVLANEDLGAILVVAGGQSAGHVAGAKEAEPEAVAFESVLFRIIPEIAPEVLRKRVLAGHV